MMACVSPRRNTKQREKFDKKKFINIIRKILVNNKKNAKNNVWKNSQTRNKRVFNMDN